jgi:outer membrane protein OmpA-like peptidoglycan-associated protein
MMRSQCWAMTLVGLFACGSAQAINVEGYSDAAYGGASWISELPDSHRDSQNGSGLRLSFGMPTSDPSLSLEVALHALERTHNGDGSQERQYGLLGNIVKDFGPMNRGKDSFLPAFTPYVIGGVGAVYDDAQTGNSVNPTVDAGGGLLFPLGYHGIAFRTQAVLLGEFGSSSNSSGGHHIYTDVQLVAGLEVPLPFVHKVAQEAPAPAVPPMPCTKVVNPYTGKKSCVVDSDLDGVPDDRDECPGTPTGTRLDEHGCPLAESTHDADGDGVPDARDACPGTALGFKVNAAGCVLPQIVVMSTITFEGRNSATISEEARPQLDGIAAMLKGQPKMHVEIGVYTDDRGKAATSLDLTRKRAGAIADYLSAQGVDPERLSAQGYGSAKPVAANDSEEGREQNRRVELKVSVE